MDEPSRDIPLSYDWIDTILVAVGFVLAVLVGIALDRAGMHSLVGSRGIYAAVVFGPVVLRRLVFGAPVLPAPRAGGMASLMSIVGLFASLIGAGLVAVAGLFIVTSFGAPRDFLAEERALAATRSELEISIHRVGEDPAVTARKDAEAAAYEEAYREKTAAEERAAFERDQKESRSTGLELGGLGTVMLALGALAAWYRYTPA